jgi:hypothetical protein
MATPNEECEALVDALLPFAVQQLEAHGDFYPYGGALNEAGQVVTVGVYQGDEAPDSLKVADDLRTALREGAGNFRATALISNVKASYGPDARQTDAIAAAVDHRDAYSVVGYFPYARDGSEPAEVFTGPGEHLIFGKGT